ncbi:MAG: IclR family transcriptional regulator, partial [Alphaproteobacteria bacterium]
LRAIRANGLAYDIDEHSDGVSAIGFAFRDWGGALHAISVPVPSTRFPRVRATIETAMRETADDITRAFA